MTGTDWIILAVLIVIIGTAAIYIIKSKKRGVKCIGCPSGCNCPGKKSGQSEYKSFDSENVGSECCRGCHYGTKTNN